MTDEPERVLTPQEKRREWLKVEARLWFVQILGETERCRPMLAELQESVVPVYRAAFDDCRSSIQEWGWGRVPWVLERMTSHYVLDPNAGDPSLFPHYPVGGERSCRNAAVAFLGWAEAHHVVDPWLLDLLSGVCVRWCWKSESAASFDTDPPHLECPSGAFPESVEQEQRPPDLGYYLIRALQRVSLRDWLPWAESWDDYRKKARPALHEFLDEFLDEYKASVEALPKGSKLPHALEDHLRWTARHYFGGETVEAISETVDREPKTVRDGIKDKRELIGLTTSERGK